jgi:RNA polymerase sigma-70 factor (ECF subfamily)
VPRDNPGLPELGDEELARAAASGDATAIDTLLRRHTNLVHAVCRRVLNNPDDALDATQEALIAIARKVHQFDGRSQPLGVFPSGDERFR